MREKKHNLDAGATKRDIQELREYADKRFDEMQANTDKRFDEMKTDTDKRFNEMKAYTDKKFDDVRGYTDGKFDEMKTYTDRRFGDYTKDTFAIFATKDDLQLLKEELKRDLPTRTQLDELLAGNEHIIQELKHMRAEHAAMYGNYRHLEKRVDRLESHVGIEG